MMLVRICVNSVVVLCIGFIFGRKLQQRRQSFQISLTWMQMSSIMPGLLNRMTSLITSLPRFGEYIFCYQYIIQIC